MERLQDLKVWESQGANSNRAVVVFSDKNYAPAAVFVLSQLRQSAKCTSLDLVFVSFDAEVCHLVSRDFPWIRTLQMRDLEYVLAHKLPEHLHFTVSAFGRMFLGPLLREDYARFVYLDGDVFWETGADVDELFLTDLEDCCVAAARDLNDYDELKGATWAEYRGELKLAEEVPYFNSGVLVIDSSRFAVQLPMFLEKLSEAEFVPRFVDQSVMNAVLQGKWVELDPVWNWQLTAYEEELSLSLGQPKLRYFVGASKYWHDPSGVFDPSYRHALQAFLRESPFEQSFVIEPILRAQGSFQRFVEAFQIYFLKASKTSKTERRIARAHLFGFWKRLSRSFKRSRRVPWQQRVVQAARSYIDARGFSERSS